MFKEMLLEQRAQSEWSALYLILVFAIAAIALVAVIKPMFAQSQQVVSKPSQP